MAQLRAALAAQCASLLAVVPWDQVAGRLGTVADGPLVVAWQLYPPHGWQDATGWQCQLRLTALGGSAPPQAAIDALLYGTWEGVALGPLARAVGATVSVGPAARSDEAAPSLLRGSLSVHIRVSA